MSVGPAGSPATRTRFAPSPTGPLHLGHAFSALTAAARGETFLLRIEDIDPQRSKPEWEALILDDLRWLGLDWPPPMRQSERIPAHREALHRLWDMGLLYPCHCNRRDIQAAASAPQEGAPLIGPDGLIYPGTCRHRPRTGPLPEGALRLDIGAALARVGTLPPWVETGLAEAQAPDLATRIGDVVLARRDFGTSYHLGVVVDDAEQGIDEVTRGLDLAEATPIHLLLQALLGLPTPRYHHHRLIRDETGRRLAKRDDARAIRRYRDDGWSPADIRAAVGL